MKGSGWSDLPAYLHLACLLFICITTANVQIITRMVFSNSPFFIWEVERLLEHSTSKYTHILIMSYWLLYFFVGIAAFSMFLPWT